MNSYYKLKRKHSDRINDFPLRFAFSNKQLKKVIDELGPPETLVSIGGGGYMRKSDRKAFDELWETNEKEMVEAMKDDGFMEEAIRYELSNHEYCITGDPTETIEILDLDMKDERVGRIFEKARRGYLNTVS